MIGKALGVGWGGVTMHHVGQPSGPSRAAPPSLILSHPKPSQGLSWVKITYMQTRAGGRQKAGARPQHQGHPIGLGTRP